jgi:hypothetical protein
MSLLRLRSAFLGSGPAPRKTNCNKVRCILKRATEEGQWLANVRNISAEGIGLITNRPVNPGMSLTMELPTSFEQTSKEVLVQVRHARPQRGNKWWILGGTFSRMLTKEEIAFLRCRAPALRAAGERRANVRHTPRLKGACPLIRVAEDGPWYATIRNVSEKGIVLIANRPFRPNTLLTVEMTNARGEHYKVRLLRVMYARPQSDSPWWLLGGTFLSKLTPEEMAALGSRHSQDVHRPRQVAVEKRF